LTAKNSLLLSRMRIPSHPEELLDMVSVVDKVSDPNLSSLQHQNNL